MRTVTLLLIFLSCLLVGCGNEKALQEPKIANIQPTFFIVRIDSTHHDTLPPSFIICPHDTTAICEFRSAKKEEYNYQKEKYSYLKNSFTHTGEVFNWQLLSGKIIFCLVLLIVLCGIIFSGIHFINHIKHQNASAKMQLMLYRLKIEERQSTANINRNRRRIDPLRSDDGSATEVTKQGHEHTSAPEPTPPKLQDTETQVEISTNGVKINSSVIGLIILALSLAFFFLYLSYVYQVTSINFDSRPFQRDSFDTVPAMPPNV